MTNSTIDITEIPAALSEALGIGEFAAGLLLSAVILLMFLMPMLILKRSKGFMSEMMVGIIIVCFCIGVQWLPYWIALVIVLLLAVMLSDKLKGWLG